MIPPSVPFDPAQDKLLICGLEDKDWSVNKAVEMTCKKSGKGFHKMVGFTRLKKKTVAGKVLEYKYCIPIQDDVGKPWYESLAIERGLPHLIWNRALTIPENYKAKSLALTMRL